MKDGMDPRMRVDLDEKDWNIIMNVLGTKLTWVEANPLLMKIGEQLRRQQPTPNGALNAADPIVEPPGSPAEHQGDDRRGA